MGSYAELRIDGYEILSTKNEVDPSVMTVFTEEDRLVRTPADEECGRTAGPWVCARRPPPGELGELESFDCAYVAGARVVRERLHVMGFTLDRARNNYEAARDARLAELREYQDSPEEPWWQDDVRALETLSFEAWIAAFRFVKERGVHAIGEVTPDMPQQFGSRYLNPAIATPAIKFILSDEESLMGWRIDDPRFFLRASLEACADDALVAQDVSELIGGGYYEPDTAITDEARALLTEGYPSNTRIIVLTEGSTDQHFLESALRLLYPHLAPYFSFMDFAGMAVPGGAGALIASVKAFAGARIANRIVALADNDTAGRDALRQLRGVELPSNFRVITYPPLPSATAWPTVGPTGLVTMDVNGLAGSIELYLGDDVLRRDDGTRVPVQWRGLVAGMGQYQGELLDKPELQVRFRRKLERSSNDPELLKTLDWSGVRAILDTLRGAFEDA